MKPCQPVLLDTVGSGGRSLPGAHGDGRSGFLGKGDEREQPLSVMADSSSCQDSTGNSLKGLDTTQGTRIAGRDPPALSRSVPSAIIPAWMPLGDYSGLR